MPAEGTVHHTNVHPRHHDSSNLVLNVAQEAWDLALRLWEVVDVPHIPGILQELLILRAQVKGKPAAIVARVQVRAIEDLCRTVGISFEA